MTLENTFFTWIPNPDPAGPSYIREDSPSVGVPGDNPTEAAANIARYEAPFVAAADSERAALAAQLREEARVAQDERIQQDEVSVV